MKITYIDNMYFRFEINGVEGSMLIGAGLCTGIVFGKIMPVCVCS